MVRWVVGRSEEGGWQDERLEEGRWEEGVLEEGRWKEGEEVAPHPPHQVLEVL